MAAKADLTAPLTPAVWSQLMAQNLAKIKNQPGPIQHTLSYPDLDELLTTTLIERPFNSLAELEAEGFTLLTFLIDIIGIPDIPANTKPQGDYEFSIINGLAQVLKKRLTTNTSGGVQRRLNSIHGLWLVSYQARNAEGGKSLTRFGATDNTDLIAELHIQPAMQRQVAMQKGATVTALTVAHRVPETAARLIAAQDVKLAAVMATRARTYAVCSDGMTGAQRAELDASIAHYGSTYKELVQPKFLAIESAETADAPASDERVDYSEGIRV